MDFEPDSSPTNGDSDGDCEPASFTDKASLDNLGLEAAIGEPLDEAALFSLDKDLRYSHGGPISKYLERLSSRNEEACGSLVKASFSDAVVLDNFGLMGEVGEFFNRDTLRSSDEDLIYSDDDFRSVDLDRLLPADNDLLITIIGRESEDCWDSSIPVSSSHRGQESSTN
jgi:hypothetical protein